MKIIVDTNTLLYAAKEKIDILEHLKNTYGSTSVILLESVEQELEKLNKTTKKASDRQAASLAIQIIKKHIPFPTVAPRGDVDSTILELAKDNEWAILTNDLELRKKAKKQGTAVLVLRQRKIITED